MDSIIIQERLGEAQALVKTLEKQSEDTLDIEELATLIWRLSSAQEVVRRLRVKLDEQLRYERDAEQRAARLEQGRRKEELDELHREGCDDMALLIDEAGRALEPVFLEVMTRRAELVKMSGEHYSLLQKITGQARPDGPLRLGAPTVVPTFEVTLPGHEFSSLYGALVAALTTATGLSAQFVNLVYRRKVTPIGLDLSRDEDTEPA